MTSRPSRVPSLARCGFALAAADLACGAAFAQPSPWRLQITADPYVDFMPAAINDRGALAGRVHAVNAAVKRGRHVSEFVYGEAVAINNRGQAVGSTFDTGAQVAAMWGPFGAVVPLNTEGIASWAEDINDRGQAVGTTQIGTNERRATVWHRGTVTYLGFGFGHGVNNDGVVVGASYDNSRPPRAALWKDGQITFLGRDTIYAASFAYAINDAGQAVGNDSSSAVLWQDGEPVYLDNSGMALDINAGGDIVGYRSAWPAIEERAMLWQAQSGAGHVAIDVNTLLRPGAAEAGWVLTRAGSINRDGEIVGIALNRALCQDPVNPVCFSYAFVLTRSRWPDEYPVPAPP